MKVYLEKIYRETKKKYYEYIENRIQNEQKTFIITANPEILMMGENDEEFNKILLDDNTQIVADGIGVIKGAKMFGIDVPERITGVELSAHLIEYCNENVN